MAAQLLILSLLLGTIETLDQTSTAASVTVSSNSTPCYTCPVCVACPSCTSSIIVAFAVSALATALLLAIIYVPVLIVVFKSYSKVIPDIVKTRPSIGGENKVHDDTRRTSEGEGEKSEEKMNGEDGGKESLKSKAVGN